jgi:hypothetical protein
VQESETEDDCADDQEDDDEAARAEDDRAGVRLLRELRGGESGREGAAVPRSAGLPGRAGPGRRRGGVRDVIGYLCPGRDTSERGKASMFRVPADPHHPTYERTFNVSFRQWLASSAAERRGLVRPACRSCEDDSRSNRPADGVTGAVQAGPAIVRTGHAGTVADRTSAAAVRHRGNRIADCLRAVWLDAAHGPLTAGATAAVLR